MKIEDKRKESRELFKNLITGDCFCYLNDYFIKTEKKFLSDNGNNGRFNAVSMISGGCYYFIDNDYVTKLNAKVVIGDD